MKVLKNLSLPVTAIIILLACLIISKECRREEDCPPEGYILVPQSFIDSLQAIANIPPDTIPGDTIRIKGDIIYVPGEVPEPIALDPQTNFYSDSIVNDSVSVWVDLTVKGTITGWDWRYSPVIFKTETIIERKVPYPMPYDVPISKNGLWAEFGFGGNRSVFLASGELDLLTKKDNLYGLQYLRFDQNNFYLFKIGTKIKF